MTVADRSVGGGSAAVQICSGSHPAVELEVLRDVIRMHKLQPTTQRHDGDPHAPQSFGIDGRLRCAQPRQGFGLSRARWRRAYRSASARLVSWASVS
jgi:hypothetical protein